MDQISIQIDKLLKAIQPTTQSTFHRDIVLAHLQETLLSSLLPSSIVKIGSTPLRTYLATSDVNLGIISSLSTSDPSSLIKLCADVLTSSALMPYSSTSSPTIRSITIIPPPQKSRPPLLTCLVNNIPATISPLGYRASLESEFLSTFNVLCNTMGYLPANGYNKFLMLLKTFFKLDSHIYTGGVPVLKGANLGTDGGGGIDGWTLCVMSVVFMVNYLKPSRPRPSTYVLFRDFLRFYGEFDWDNGVVRLKGGEVGTLGYETFKVANEMQEEFRRVQGKAGSGEPFQYGVCNVIDPLDNNENLGDGVSGAGVKGLRNGCREGGRTCEGLEIWCQNKGGEFPYHEGETSNPNSPRRRGRGGACGDEAADSSPRILSPHAAAMTAVTPSQALGSPSQAVGSTVPPPIDTNVSPTKHENAWGDDWFLQAFFPNTWNLTGPNLGLRPDIVEGPAVRWSDAEINTSHSQDGSLDSVVKRGVTSRVNSEVAERKDREDKKDKERRDREKKDKESAKKKKNKDNKTTDKVVQAVANDVTLTLPTTTYNSLKWKLLSFLLLLYILVPSPSLKNEAGSSDLSPTAMSLPSLPSWIALGSSLSLGDTAPEDESAFVWTKDGKVIEGETGAFLNIVDAKEEDEGLYVREVRGVEQLSTSLLSRTQIRVAQPPMVEDFRGYYEVEVGGKLMLSVESTGGVPEPEYQWRLNGVELAGRTSSMLVVDDISTEMGGTYTCEVENEAGRVLWEEAVVVIKEM